MKPRKLTARRIKLALAATLRTFGEPIRRALVRS